MIIPASPLVSVWIDDTLKHVEWDDLEGHPMVVHSPRPSLSAKVFQLIARVAPNATVIYHAPNPGSLVCVIRYHADLSWLRDELEWLRHKHGTYGCQVEWRFEQ